MDGLTALTRQTLTYQGDNQMDMNKYYKQLEGATITKFVGLTEEEHCLEPFPVFHATLKDGTKMKLEISRDPEGNGGGFIFQSEVDTIK